MPHRKSQKPGSPEKRPPRAKKTARETATAVTIANGDKEKGSSKMTLCTAPTMAPRPQMRERRPGRPPSGKRLAMARAMPGKVRAAARRSLDPCDNSNDSGLGFDHHMDQQHAMSMGDRLIWTGERAEAKRPRLDIKLESEEISDGYSFPPDAIRSCKESTSLIRTAPACSAPSLSMNSNQTASQGRAVPRCIPLMNRHSPSSPVSLTTQLSSSSRYMDISLSIIKQPEQQHRARYQTEGSRGAVKDRDGNGFPIVQLSGYHKPATLQVFIGTDVGKVAPHMFYQACRVSGKNSTPCSEKKIDGTIVIELQLDPGKDMLATCDCVGILKERNVDVEHRFPDQLGSRSKKKSTRCRMIFRTTITHDDGAQETLQVCSQPIVCTQPPGIPEICKKSLTSCPATGGLELFVLGKNFLKDTRIYFQQNDDERHIRWEQSVAPDKEFLQQTHFVCVVPPFVRPDITEPVTVRLYVVSSGKTSEPHTFVYTPVNGAMPSVRVDPTPQAPFLSKMLWSNVSKQEQDLGMMPPPGTNLVPLRRSSTSVASTSEIHSPPMRVLKQELVDESSQSSVLDPLEIRTERYRHLSESSLDVHQGDSNMSMITENSMDMLRHHGGMSSMEMISSNMECSSMSMSENSIDMIRRVQINRPMPIYEGSMDVNISNSSMMNNEDSSCSSMMACERLMPPQMKPTVMLPAAQIDMPIEDMKGIDLRMKMPMATVADLVNTSAPSLATLHKFGVTEASSAPLPAQSAQSVENYLTTIESAKLLQSMAEKEKIAQMMIQNGQVLQAPQTLLPNATQNLSAAESEPIFVTPQQQLSKTSQNETVVAKSEAAAIAEQTLSQQTSLTSAAISVMSAAQSVPTPINTERLDALVNSTVESHICSPSSDCSPKERVCKQSPRSDIMLSPQDVMLSSQSSLMVSPVLNNSPSPASDSSPNLSTDVIMNPQISPSIMCRNSQDPILPNAIEPNLIPPQITVNDAIAPQAMASLLTTATNGSLHSSIGNTEAEKEILFKATVDLLQTQKKICELEKTSPRLEKVHIMNDFLSAQPPMSQLSNAGSNYIQPQFTAGSGSVSPNLMPSKTVVDNKNADFVIPVPVKEMGGVSPAVQDKKSEDMIPSSFATMSETDLINIINPSCFDQGNTFQ